MTRLLLILTVLATLLLGCADQSNSVRPDEDGEFTSESEAAGEQGPGSGSPDVDEDGEQAQEVDADGTESPVGESAAQPLPEPLTGTLGIEDIEGGCPFLEAAGQRYELVAGPGAEVVVDPGNGVIADTDGNVIAETGDTITVEGSIDPGMASFCQIGQILVVESITAGS